MPIKNVEAQRWFVEISNLIEELTEQRRELQFDSLPFDVVEFYDTHEHEGHPTPSNPGPRWTRKNASRYLLPHNFSGDLHAIDKLIDGWVLSQNAALDAWEEWRYVANATLTAKWVLPPACRRDCVKAERKKLHAKILALLAYPSVPTSTAINYEIWDRRDRHNRNQRDFAES